MNVNMYMLRVCFDSMINVNIIQIKSIGNWTEWKREREREREREKNDAKKNSRNINRHEHI